MNKSLNVTTVGSFPPPLAPVAAARVIPNGLPVSDDCVKVLCSICLGMMSEMMSPDAMYLAMCRAEDMALAHGVTPENWARLRDLVVRTWERRRAQNPLSGMF
jgi:hypothetical protein